MSDEKLTEAELIEIGQRESHAGYGKNGMLHIIHITQRERKLLLAAARKGIEAEWKPIETAPTDCAILLGGPNDLVAWGGWSEQYHCWWGACGRIEATHWMALPDSPAPTQSEGDCYCSNYETPGKIDPLCPIHSPLPLQGDEEAPKMPAREIIERAIRRMCADGESHLVGAIYVLKALDEAGYTIEPSPHGNAIDVAKQLRKNANDLDNLADSYAGQRQEKWFRLFAEDNREAASLIERQAAELSDERDTRIHVEKFLENVPGESVVAKAMNAAAELREKDELLADKERLLRNEECYHTREIERLREALEEIGKADHGGSAAMLEIVFEGCRNVARSALSPRTSREDEVDGPKKSR